MEMCQKQTRCPFLKNGCFSVIFHLISGSIFHPIFLKNEIKNEIKNENCEHPYFVCTILLEESWKNHLYQQQTLPDMNNSVVQCSLRDTPCFFFSCSLSSNMAMEVIEIFNSQPFRESNWIGIGKKYLKDAPRYNTMQRNTC